MWMSFDLEINRIIMLEDWEAFQKKGLAELDFAMLTLAGVKGYLTYVASGYKDFLRLKYSFGDANP